MIPWGFSLDIRSVGDVHVSNSKLCLEQSGTDTHESNALEIEDILTVCTYPIY